MLLKGIFLKIPTNFYQKESHQSFTIQTKRKEYKCNIFGVIFSEVIKKIISNDPTIEYYKYDFDDEKGEFQLICDIFNLNSVKLAKDNYDIIKEIAEDLEIQSILEYLMNMIKKTIKYQD